MLNKQKGNMYGWVTHTWNPIKGKCYHDCTYCYMKRFPQNPIRLVEKEFKTNLGKGNFIFVGSSTDMFAKDVNEAWIVKVLDYCRKFDNKYLFQSKNPQRMLKFMDYYPPNSIFGTTIETDVAETYLEENTPLSKAPSVEERVEWITKFNHKMVSIEPILPFNTDIMIEYIKTIKPEFVSIGAESKGHYKYEPEDIIQIKKLIAALKDITNLKVKDNLLKILNKKQKEHGGSKRKM